MVETHSSQPATTTSSTYSRLFVCVADIANGVVLLQYEASPQSEMKENTAMDENIFVPISATPESTPP
jgi:hypothetical protein